MLSMLKVLFSRIAGGFSRLDSRSSWTEKTFNTKALRMEEVSHHVHSETVTQALDGLRNLIDITRARVVECLWPNGCTNEDITTKSCSNALQELLLGNRDIKRQAWVALKRIEESEMFVTFHILDLPVEYLVPICPVGTKTPRCVHHTYPGSVSRVSKSEGARLRCIRDGLFSRLHPYWDTQSWLGDERYHVWDTLELRVYLVSIIIIPSEYDDLRRRDPLFRAKSADTMRLTYTRERALCCGFVDRGEPDSMLEQIFWSCQVLLADSKLPVATVKVLEAVLQNIKRDRKEFVQDLRGQDYGMLWYRYHSLGELKVDQELKKLSPGWLSQQFDELIPDASDLTTEESVVSYFRATLPTERKRALLYMWSYISRKFRDSDPLVKGIHWPTALNEVLWPTGFAELCGLQVTRIHRPTPRNEVLWPKGNAELYGLRRREYRCPLTSWQYDINRECPCVMESFRG